MAPALKVSPKEYLEQERKAEFRSEYVDGTIVPMPGASREHNLIETNLLRELSHQLKHRNCEVYGGNMKVRTRQRYSYPDATVVCDNPLFEDLETDVLLNPTVVIEVLSPSTEIYDRGEKFAAYRERESLKEYLLISQNMQHVEIFKRQTNGWHFSEVRGLAGSVKLESVNCLLRLADIYEKISFQTE
jgi:Uma2 family endonuclease